MHALAGFALLALVCGSRGMPHEKQSTGWLTVCDSADCFQIIGSIPFDPWDNFEITIPIYTRNRIDVFSNMHISFLLCSDANFTGCGYLAQYDKTASLETYPDDHGRARIYQKDASIFIYDDWSGSYKDIQESKDIARVEKIITAEANFWASVTEDEHYGALLNVGFDRIAKEVVNYEKIFSQDSGPYFSLGVVISSY